MIPRLARPYRRSRPERVSCLAAVVLCLVSGPVVPAEDAGPAARLDAFVERSLPDWETTGLAVAIVDDGEVVLAKGYGVRSLETGEPVDSATLFAIGSTTKAMTAALVGQLVARGDIGWDDPVIDPLPAFRLHDPWVTREVTVRDLFLHRAGLGNADLLWYGSDRSFDEIVSSLRRLEPAYSFRDGFVYQNLMYAVAGELAATIDEEPWTSLLARRIFDPLGMERSVPTLAETANRTNVAVPHDRVDGTVTPIRNAPVDPVAPAGSVWSSAAEMARWIEMLLGNGVLEGERILAAEIVEEMFRPQTIVPRNHFYPTARLTRPHWTTYGLGWFQQDYRGRMVQYHTGSIDGMSAIVGLVPEAGFGLVVLQNLDHSELRHAILWKAVDLFVFDDSSRDWNEEILALYEEIRERGEAARTEAEAGRREGTRPSVSPQRFAGGYEHPIYGIIEVRQEEDGLWLTHEARWSGTLEHWHYDTFRVVWDRPWREPMLVTFHLGPGGEPAELEVFGEEFTRRPESEEAEGPTEEGGRG